MEALLPESNPPALSDPERLRVNGTLYDASDIIEALDPHLTPERRERISETVSARTTAVAVVVEGLANTGNVSAVMRSAEALGYLPFHAVLGEARYKSSKRTSQGAEKWLDVHRWETPRECADHLRAAGYRIVATHLDSAKPISAFDFARDRIALVFGNEREGVTEAMLAEADDRMIIPMAGFAQSFNISVAAAVSLYHAYRDRVEHLGAQGDLTPRERHVLTADYYLRSISAAGKILHRSFNGRDASRHQDE